MGFYGPAQQNQQNRLYQWFPNPYQVYAGPEPANNRLAPVVPPNSQKSTSGTQDQDFSYASDETDIIFLQSKYNLHTVNYIGQNNHFIYHSLPISRKQIFLVNSTINVSKDENLTRLLDSFHTDRPKGRRGIPSWNLSLVLHQLTKAPFEPLKEASLKHLTFKTVFLLALGSGKRRSEIHAWLHKNIRHQSDWSKVSLYPSPSFLSKNQLAKEGPDSVAPVVIPALAPTLDKSLKGDRSLCPVRALRYYLDRTSDLRQNKELVFVSFNKGFDKDISPATISSWIKQTSLTLHQVKAHDFRAFAASKAFQSGVSLEQILSACHWKSHNTFTQFYLKDVAWADTELFHLGPVVAAQQVHHQAQK